MCPKYSVIIPVYNMAPFLRECLDSVLASRDKLSGSVGLPADQLAEVICVDDGSTDDSIAILNSYADRVRVICQQNAGVSVARNAGLEQSHGEYICFVDADDSVQVEWLEEYDRIFRSTDADLVRLGMESVVFEGAALRRWAWQEMAQNGYNWKYAVRRSIAVRGRFPVGVAYCEDSLYTMQLIPHLKKAAQASHETYNYRVRSGSAMRATFCSDERLRFLEAIVAICGMMPDYDIDVVSRSVLGNVLVWIGRPRDVYKRSELRALLLRLEESGFIRLGFMRGYALIQIKSFLVTGWIWPSQLIARIVAILVYVKHACMLR